MTPCITEANQFGPILPKKPPISAQEIMDEDLEQHPQIVTSKKGKKIPQAPAVPIIIAGEKFPAPPGLPVFSDMEGEHTGGATNVVNNKGSRITSGINKGGALGTAAVLGGGVNIPPPELHPPHKVVNPSVGLNAGTSFSTSRNKIMEAFDHDRDEFDEDELEININRDSSKMDVEEHHQPEFLSPRTAARKLQEEQERQRKREFITTLGAPVLHPVGANNPSTSQSRLLDVNEFDVDSDDSMGITAGRRMLNKQKHTVVPSGAFGEVAAAAQVFHRTNSGAATTAGANASMQMPAASPKPFIDPNINTSMLQIVALTGEKPPTQATFEQRKHQALQKFRIYENLPPLLIRPQLEKMVFLLHLVKLIFFDCPGLFLDLQNLENQLSEEDAWNLKQMKMKIKGWRKKTLKDICLYYPEFFVVLKYSFKSTTPADENNNSEIVEVDVIGLAEKCRRNLLRANPWMLDQVTKDFSSSRGILNRNNSSNRNSGTSAATGSGEEEEVDDIYADLFQEDEDHKQAAVLGGIAYGSSEKNKNLPEQKRFLIPGLREEGGSKGGKKSSSPLLAASTSSGGIFPSSTNNINLLTRPHSSDSEDNDNFPLGADALTLSTYGGASRNKMDDLALFYQYEDDVRKLHLTNEGVSTIPCLGHAYLHSVKDDPKLQKMCPFLCAELHKKIRRIDWLGELEGKAKNYNLPDNHATVVEFKTLADEEIARKNQDRAAEVCPLPLLQAMRQDILDRFGKIRLTLLQKLAMVIAKNQASMINSTTLLCTQNNFSSFLHNTNTHVNPNIAHYNASIRGAKDKNSAASSCANKILHQATNIDKLKHCFDDWKRYFKVPAETTLLSILREHNAFFFHRKETDFVGLTLAGVQLLFVKSPVAAAKVFYAKFEINGQDITKTSGAAGGTSTAVLSGAGR
ncbi:unnamed protein product [Amoebophrya sp. A120]|nr:unnamed protein product [Amoebophrya sp. A120]|eukprot:GSA120T00007563001.1